MSDRMLSCEKDQKLNGLVQSEFEKYGAVTDVYNTGKG